MRDELQRAVIDHIAVVNGIDPENLNAYEKGALLYRRGDELLCLGQISAPYWKEMVAEVIAIGV